MDFYWEMFAQSGNVEDYLKYKTSEQKNHEYRRMANRAELKPYRKMGQLSGF